MTGAAGFAGGHLVDRLLADGAAPLVGWYKPGGDPPAALPRLTWEAVDMLDAGGVRRALARARPSAVYHCAGAPHAGQSWQTAAATLEVNVLATHHLFEAVRALGTPVPVLVPGSALVYRPSLSALDEEAAIGPNNPYATSKLAQEQLSLHVARDEGWPVFVTRSFPHIGPRQDPSFAAASFARQVARIEAGLDEPVIHVGNLEAERDLLDVRDVVRAYVALVARGRPGRVYNVCAGRAYRVAEILDRLLALAGVRVGIQQDADRMRPSDTPRVLGDAGRIREEVGWLPEIPLDRTLADLLAYWREQLRLGKR